MSGGPAKTGALEPQRDYVIKKRLPYDPEMSRVDGTAVFLPGQAN